MYVHGFTTSENIMKDLAQVFTEGDTIVPENNWELVYPESGDLEDIEDVITFKVQPQTVKLWVKREKATVDENGLIAIAEGNKLADGGGSRIYVRDKKYFLYYTDKVGEEEDLDVLEYKKADETTFQTNISMANKEVLLDYEKEVDVNTTYFVRIEKPEKLDSGANNHHFIQWTVGEDYDSTEDLFPVDKESRIGKLNWFKETENSEQIAKEWLPIEYWISFDRNAGVGVVMGDPGLSVSDWQSSPFYFGSLRQIDGALETDLNGNFAGFSGSFSEPTLSKQYGDYTGTGSIDVIMASSKTGRPYQAHKVQIFGGYEFREKTFNGQSAHTGKHAVSDIVLADVHENDRGILRHCLAVPRVAKTHACELIYNRYISGEEERYIFLNINANYTPFNTGPDSLIGIAIRTDI